MKQGEHPRIIVCFVRRSVRNEIFRVKKELKRLNSTHDDKSKIFINKDLIEASNDQLRTSQYNRKKSLFTSA